MVTCSVWRTLTLYAKLDCPLQSTKPVEIKSVWQFYFADSGLLAEVKNDMNKVRSEVGAELSEIHMVSSSVTATMSARCWDRVRTAGMCHQVASDVQ